MRGALPGHDARVSYLAPLGRALFALIFVWFGPSMFDAGSIAKAASKGVPLASIAVPFGGVLAIAGAILVATGYRARIGAAMIAAFLLPVTFFMHAYWTIPDAAAAGVQKVMFLKNLSMLGAALVFVTQGAGPISVDAWLARRRPRGAD
jgi:putative oxidoreductase